MSSRDVLKRTALILTVGCWLLLPIAAQAQIWDITLSLNPNPSPYISEWETNPTSVGQATIFNRTQGGQEVVLSVTLFKSDLGLLVEAESPSIFVSSFGTRVVNNTEFIGFSTADYNNTSVKNQVFRTGRLPEGLYTGCVQVRNLSGANLSSRVCQEFEIIYPDPPQLIYPSNGAEITTEFPTFQWVPVNVPAEYDIIYTFKVVEILEGQVASRALSANVPLLERSDIFTTNFSYPLDALPFEEGNRYAWQVQALDQFGLAPASNQGRSEIFTFTFGTTEEDTTTEETITRETSTEPCGGDCLAAEPAGSPSGRTFSAGDELQIGHFVLTLTDVTGTGTGLSGQGEISVPFLNDVRISVQFESLGVNESGVVVSGSATATEDIPSVTWSDVESTVSGSPVSVPSPTPEQSEVFHDIFEGGERVVSALTGDRAMGMPLGMSSDGTGGVGYTVGITTMEFGPRRASLDALLTFDIPSLGDKMVALGADDICFTPAGLGEQGKLYLARDWEIVQEGGTRFALAGLADASGDTTQATYADWGCDGFNCVQVRGFVEFPEDKLIKETETGGTAAGPVEGRFSFRACDGRNFLARIDIDPFRVSGMNGWGFRVQDAWLDFSDIENPTDFTLPENYEDPSLSDPRLETTWTGFYLELAELHAPQGFEDQSVAGRARVAVHDLIIDGTGVTASIRAENLIDYDDGNVKGWAFSLDAIELNILQSSFESGSLNGGLGLPISADRLDYSSTLSLTEEDNIHYDFIVSAGTEGYRVSAWKAELNLASESNITFEYNEGEEASTHLSATLHGSLGLDVDAVNKVPGLNFRGIEFENLLLSTEDPYFDVGDTGVDGSIFGFASPQKGASGFPVTINDIKLVNKEGSITKPGLQFTTKLNLTEDISANLTFGIYGDLTIPGAGERFDFEYHETNLKAIQVHANLKSVTLDGEVIFYEDGSKEGVYGSLAVTMPIGVTAELEAEFGKAVEAGENYRYWYVYGLVTFPGGIDIFSGFALYGLGGGVYHNMTRPPDDGIRQPITVNTSGDSRNPAPEKEESSKDPSEIYVPDKGTYLGIKVQAIMGVKGEEKAFNMDVIIEAEVARSRGGGSHLQSLRIHGEGKVMTDINTDDPSSPIEASVDIEFQNRPPDKFIDGNIGIKINLKNIIYGCGEDNTVVNAQFHADFSSPEGEVGAGKQWWFYIGEMHPDRRACLKLDLKITEATLESYFMVGTKVPSGLPPLPSEVEALLGGTGGDDTRYDDSGGEVTTSANTSLRNEIESFRPGKGFATGAHFHAGADITFIIIYATLDAWAGFDFNLVQQRGRCVETGRRPGVNGYYGQGQVYVALQGEVGIKVNLWFIKKKIPFLYLGAAAQMAGKLPDPNWFMGRVGLKYSVLGGLISGHANMKVEFGQECTLMTDYNPFAGIEFIDRIEPETDKKVDVYTNPTAYFNLEVNKVLAIPNGEESDDPGGVTEYQPFIDDFRLTNLETGISDEGSYELQKDGLVADYTIGRDLEGLTDYRTSITVKAWELLRSGGRELVTIPDTVIEGEPIGPWREWEETKEVEFSTLAEPTELQEDQIVFSYPVKRQNFFLKGEVRDNEGLIKLKNPVTGLFDNYIDLNQDGENQDNEHYQDYFAKFINVKTGETIERELNYNVSRAPRRIILPLPPELENETFYALQLVARQRPEVMTIGTPVEVAGGEEEDGDDFGVFDTGGIQSAFDSDRYADPVTPERMGFAVDGEFFSTTARVGKAIQKLPGNDVGDREHLIYSYYFGTSRYNTLQEKLSGINFDPEHHRYWSLEYFTLSTTLDEPFDTFDINGLYKDGRQVMRPLVYISTTFRHANAFGDEMDELYDYYDDLRRTSPYRVPMSELIGNSIDLNVTIPIPIGSIDFWGKGMPPVHAVYPSSDNFIIGGVSELKMKDEAGLIPDAVKDSFWYRAFSEGLGEYAKQFKVRYDVGIYVRLHASRLKNRVTRIMSTNTARYAFDNTRFMQTMMSHFDNGWEYQREYGDVWPTFSTLMFRESPYLLGQTWRFLSKELDDYSLQRGRYNLYFRYRIPSMYGIRSGSDIYRWFRY